MSRIAERLATRGEKPYKILTETFSGPTSYATGGSVFNSTIFRQLERATALQVTGGLTGEVVTGSVSGNAFTLKVYTGTASGATEVANAVSLVSKAITVLLEGL
jgi:hypothetical protein